MTIESYPNGNPPNGPIMVAAAVVSPGVYNLTRVKGGASLATNVRGDLLAAACRALRQAGESRSAYVTVLTPTNTGALVQGPSGGIDYGYALLGPNAGV